MSTRTISFQIGLPPREFFSKAWASEPLVSTLDGANVSFALPALDKDISLIAKEDDLVIGQCSANRAVNYWSHIEHINVDDQNLPTRIFIAINKKAVQDEMKHLDQIGESSETAFHSAGIAVLPNYRGQRLGIQMRERQINLCKENKMTTLFCEITNPYSKATVENLRFTKIAEYPYKTLAEELNYPDLAKINDCYSVWCLKI